ncbi:MAG: UDP-N-acetylmuramoylalanine--D-glutamate ligase [Aliidongia sp.]|nr:UDP-N-acetylmuramoylalanine--D-glutamate ligase [Aliidongia sp.]
MIPLPAFRDRTVAVLGLARSGLAAAEALRTAGAHVLAWDDDAETRQALAAAGVALTELASLDPSGWAALVMSPGIPLTHPAPHAVAARARATGVPVIGDIELLWRAETGARFLGITGTNGKSTTTTLIGHILSEAKRPVAIGGNLGTPVLSLPTLSADGSYVIEMSSYQLDLIDRARFAVALLLNVTPDHLDRHGDMAGYVAAKRRIFRNQITGDTAIIGVDDDWCRAVADEIEATKARVIRISAERVVPGGVYVLDGKLIDDTGADAQEIMDLRPIARLPGAHNWQNAAAAYAACRACHLDTETITAALASFAGLAHRQELVVQHRRIRFVNDSKATNADAAAKALACYDAIHWIAGGVAKAGGIESLAPFFPRIRHAYLIGSAAQQFQETLGEAVPSTLCGDLPTAVRAAATAAEADAADTPVVLLSPACASFDQYRNFEIRGEAFRGLVLDLVAEAAR